MPGFSVSYSYASVVDETLICSCCRWDTNVLVIRVNHYSPRVDMSLNYACVFVEPIICSWCRWATATDAFLHCPDATKYSRCTGVAVAIFQRLQWWEATGVAQKGWVSGLPARMNRIPTQSQQEHLRSLLCLWSWSRQDRWLVFCGIKTWPWVRYNCSEKRNTRLTTYQQQLFRFTCNTYSDIILNNLIHFIIPFELLMVRDCTYVCFYNAV